MRLLAIIALVIVFLSCQKEEAPFVEPCPSCVCIADANGENWIARPGLSLIRLTDHQDTVFHVSITKETEAKGRYDEVLSLRNIPYAEGVYTLDSIQYNSHETKGRLYLGEFGGWCYVLRETYSTISDGTSVVEVEYIDRKKMTYLLNFHIEMYVHGDKERKTILPGYPDKITLNGFTEGVFVNE